MGLVSFFHLIYSYVETDKENDDDEIEARLPHQGQMFIDIPHHNGMV